MQARGVGYAECYLNEAVARLLVQMLGTRLRASIDIRHCQNIICCIRYLEETTGLRSLIRLRGRRRTSASAIIGFIDHERNHVQSKLLERLVNKLECTGHNCARGIEIYTYIH